MRLNPSWNSLEFFLPSFFFFFCLGRYSLHRVMYCNKILHILPTKLPQSNRKWSPLSSMEHFSIFQPIVFTLRPSSPWSPSLLLWQKDIVNWSISAQSQKKVCFDKQKFNLYISYKSYHFLTLTKLFYAETWPNLKLCHNIKLKTDTWRIHTIHILLQQWVGSF